MKTKLTFSLAALMLVGGLATAQPAPEVTAAAATTASETSRPARRDDDGQRMRPQADGGPFAKLHIARRIEDLTDEQRAKIDQFLAREKEGGEALQAEFREAMKKAREATDRESRRAAMKEVQEKFRAADAKVDAFLKETLTEVQHSKLIQRAEELRRGSRGRAREMRDGNTTGTAGEGRGWEKNTRERQMKDQKPGKTKGDKAGGKKGMKMRQQDNGATPAPAGDDATTSSASMM